MSTVQVDAINESTTNAGVTVDGVLIKDSKILYEYDMYNKRMLNRSQALNKTVLRSTFNKLKQNKKN